MEQRTSQIEDTDAKHKTYCSYSLFRWTEPSKYTKFIMEVNQYMKQSGLHYFPKEQVGILPNFIKGCAIDFYLQKIGMNNTWWTLSQFFRGLMDFCFPSNFVETLRREFNTLKQGNRVIQEYLYNLEMKAINLGNISNRDLTRRAWDRLHPKYQRQLQLDCLNPDTVLYEEFKDKLENIEKANEAVGIK